MSYKIEDHEEQEQEQELIPSYEFMELIPDLSLAELDTIGIGMGKAMIKGAIYRE